MTYEHGLYAEGDEEPGKGFEGVEEQKQIWLPDGLPCDPGGGWFRRNQDWRRENSSS